MVALRGTGRGWRGGEWGEGEEEGGGEERQRGLEGGRRVGAVGKKGM